MKKFGKLTAALVVMAAAIGMTGCKPVTGGGKHTPVIKETVATPDFSVPSGTVESGTEVTISCTTEGAAIYYTTDGSDPTEASLTYSKAISIIPPMTIKAIGVKDGMNDSEVASAEYKPNYGICEVGDFILKDGSILPKSETPAAASVAAVIVRAADKSTNTPALGVGITQNQAGLSWCKWESVGFNTNITALQGDKSTGYTDGSTSWAEVKEVCSDATDEDASKYPAFEYCLKYATGKGFSNALATGWYLPTLAELNTIYDNMDAINLSLKAAGGNEFVDSSYWSCSQDTELYYCAFDLHFLNGATFNANKGSMLCVCAVRAFN